MNNPDQCYLCLKHQKQITIIENGRERAGDIVKGKRNRGNGRNQCNGQNFSFIIDTSHIIPYANRASTLIL